MTTRAKVQTRRAIRKTLFGLLLTTVLSLEALTMSQVYHQWATVPGHTQPSIDLASCFGL